ncbi:MAG: YkvA family protein [Bacillota bacterium]
MNKFSLKYREWVKRLLKEVNVIYLASKDPRTPWFAKLLMGVVLAYVASPIDLIPDFIPVLGFLDDMLLVPLGIYCVLKLIPPEIIVESRREAGEIVLKQSFWFTLTIVGIWIGIAIWIVSFLLNFFRPKG